MPFVERTYHQSGYITTDYFETTIEFVGIAQPPHRLPEGDAYLLTVFFPGETPSVQRFSWNHTAPIVNGNFYDPIIHQIGNLQKSLIDTSGGIGVRLLPTLGDIVFDLENGRNLALAQKSWPDKEFVLFRGPRYGAQSLDLTEFELVYRGRFKGCRYNPEFMTLSVSDTSRQITQAASSAVYTSSDVYDINETPDLIGKHRPRIWGAAFLVSPILLSNTLQYYDLHFRRIYEVLQLYDNMRPLTFVGNHTTLTSLLDPASSPRPAPGQYITCYEQGRLLLGSVPVGRLATNIEGDYDTGFELNDTKVDRLLLRILAEYASNVNLESAAFNTLASSQAYQGGFYLSPDDTSTVADALDLLCQSLGAVWLMTNNDLIRFQIFGFNTAYRTITDADVISWERDIPLPPVWRVEVLYVRAYTVHLDSDLRDVQIAPGARSFALNEWRVSEKEDTNIRDADSGARLLRVETVLSHVSFADDLRDNLFTLHSVERDLVHITTQDQNFADEVGQTVHFDSTLLGLDKDMIVVRINERISQRETDITLWG